jgi:hypothetical protein
MLIVIMLSVVMLNVVMLNVVMLNVVMLSVVAPGKGTFTRATEPVRLHFLIQTVACTVKVLRS